jgi:hypothetical protein
MPAIEPVASAAPQFDPAKAAFDSAVKTRSLKPVRRFGYE